MTANRGFGIDIGGSGIKGALVDLERESSSASARIDTPQPSTPEAVADRRGDIVRPLEWDGPVGVTLPAVVKKGVAQTAANIDHSWIGRTPMRCSPSGSVVLADVAILNDADAAGIAEIRFGDRPRRPASSRCSRSAPVSAAPVPRRELVPNTEFGHIEVDGHDAEKRPRPRSRTTRASLPGVGQTGKSLSDRVGEPDLAGSVHRRRRREQEGGEVGAAVGHPNADDHGIFAEQRGHRRRRRGAVEGISH